MKHLKDQAKDLRALFERGIPVREIAVFDLCHCRTDDEADPAREKMYRYDFDIMPVTADDKTVGYVCQEDLKTGMCGQYARPIEIHSLVTADMAIPKLLPLFKERTWFFVLDGNEVKGIVTKGDLQRMPVRMLLFSTTTLLEMQLLRIIRLYFPDEGWTSKLEPNELRGLQGRFNERRKRNESLGLDECLSLAQKVRIVSRQASLSDRLHLQPEAEPMKLARAMRRSSQ